MRFSRSRRAATAVLAALALAGATLSSAAGAVAVRTFDAEPLGAAPANTRTYGTVSVQNVAVGNASTRAVQVLDSSATAQSRVMFLQGPAPQRRYEFDYVAKTGSLATIFALHGTGASENTGFRRFMVYPASAGSTTGVIAAYNGTSWVSLGQVPGLRDPNQWSRIVIEGSTTWVSITARGVRFTTTLKAAAASNITSLEVASAGTGSAGQNDYIDNLSIENTGGIVSTEPAGYQPRFPDVVKLKDGRLLAVWQSAPAHTGTNDTRIKMSYSTNGAVWSSPTVAADLANLDDRDPKVSVLADGTVLLNWFVDQWTSATAYTNKGLYTARLAPGATTFSAPQHVPTTSGVGFSHGPTVQAGGDVILPYYNGGVWLIRSHDGGVSWDTSTIKRVLPETTDRTYMEPNIVKLSSGQLVMVIRTGIKGTSTEIASVLMRSSDNGLTWTAPVSTGFATSSHHMLATSSGAVLLTYGQIGQPRPTYGAMITNPAGTWSPSIDPAKLLFDAGHGDQANPSSAELSPGVFVTLGYDVATRQLLSFKTNAAFWP